MEKKKETTVRGFGFKVWGLGLRFLVQGLGFEV